MKEMKMINRILLGLLMFIPGIMKLTAVLSGNDFVTGMVSGIFLFSWAPSFWAWILILSEVLFGLAILFNWKLKYTTIPPMFILLVAVLFMTIKWGNLASTSWGNVLFHLLALNGYALLMAESKQPALKSKAK